MFKKILYSLTPRRRGRKEAEMLVIMNQAQGGNGRSIDENEFFGGNRKTLCRAGEIASTKLRLPRIIKDLRRIGGSQFSITAMTALRVANGNGFDPEVIESDPRLGSRSISKWFEENDDMLVKEVNKSGGIDIAAVHKLMPNEMMRGIIDELTQVICELVFWEGDTLLVTNLLRVSLAIELLTGIKIDYNIAELGFIVVDAPGAGKPEIVTTSIPDLGSYLLELKNKE